MEWLDEVLAALIDLIIITGLVFLALFIGYHVLMRELGRPLHPAVSWANELFSATDVVEKWMDEGKLERRDRIWISHMLIKLAGRNSERAARTLRLIAGPNGWAVYQMLLVQRKSWRRFLFRKWLS